MTDAEDTHPGESAGTSENPYSGFKPVVSVSILNYRYYSPELGRWLSREPINQVGSPAWWMDNAKRVRLKRRLQKIETQLSNIYIISSTYPQLLPTTHNILKYIKIKSLIVKYEIQMDLLGKRGNFNIDNPYCFARNNAVILWDFLGNYLPTPFPGQQLMIENEDNWFNHVLGQGQANGQFISTPTTWGIISVPIIEFAIAAYIGFRFEFGIALGISKCGICIGLYAEGAIALGSGFFLNIINPTTFGFTIDISSGPSFTQPEQIEGTYSNPYLVFTGGGALVGGYEGQVMVDFNPDIVAELDWSNPYSGGGGGGSPVGGEGIIGSIGVGIIKWLWCKTW